MNREKIMETIINSLQPIFGGILTSNDPVLQVFCDNLLSDFRSEVAGLKAENERLKNEALTDDADREMGIDPYLEDIGNR
jgi:hypothetical protein